MDSENFKLDAGGSVSITGAFTSVVDRSRCIINDARIEMYRLMADGTWKMGSYLSAWGTNDTVGRLVLYGPDANDANDTVPNVTLAGYYSGGAIAISNGSGDVKIQLGIDGNGDGYVAVNGHFYA